mmetsp:Transcript_14692/g.25193  ORF Transcript_14692/g.25193 Transcript_14692/m.25193 type:complete len:226 (+) Transcript_14692:551-1228(+)
MIFQIQQGQVQFADKRVVRCTLTGVTCNSALVGRDHIVVVDVDRFELVAALMPHRHLQHAVQQRQSSSRQIKLRQPLGRASVLGDVSAAVRSAQQHINVHVRHHATRALHTASTFDHTRQTTRSLHRHFDKRQRRHMRRRVRAAVGRRRSMPQTALRQRQRFTRHAVAIAQTRHVERADRHCRRLFQRRYALRVFELLLHAFHVVARYFADFAVEFACVPRFVRF